MTFIVAADPSRITTRSAATRSWSRRPSPLDGSVADVTPPP
jgi:hypothetical protein